MKAISILLLLLNFFCHKSFAEIVVLATNKTYNGNKVTSGTAIPKNGIIGYLIEPLADPTGCSVVNPPVNEWIALVKRGNCSSVEKLSNMQASGAIAVVMEDPGTNNDVWIRTIAAGNTYEITISGIQLTQDAYEELLNFISKMTDSPVMVLLQDTVSNLPFLEILRIISPVAIVVVLIVYILWLLRDRKTKKQEEIPVDVMSRLEKRYFGADKKENEEEQCSICLEIYQKGEELRVLPCRHSFHAKCVNAWLAKQKKSCPYCRQDITMPDDPTIPTVQP